MNEQNTKQIIDAITPLADKIGQGAAHLYTIYTRQILIEGIIGLVEIPFCIAMLYSLFWVLRKLWRGREEYEGTIPVALFLGLGALLFVVTFVLLWYGIEISLGQVFNPEYYALDRIITTVQGSKP